MAENETQEVAAEVKEFKAVETKAADSFIDPNKVTVPREEREKELNELAGFRKAKADADKATKEAQEKALIDQGKHSELLKERDATINANVAAITEKDRAIAELTTKLREGERKFAEAIASRDFLSALPINRLATEASARHLATIVGDQIEAKEVGGKYVTQTKDGKTLAEFVKAIEADAEYANYFKGNSGGAGADGSRATPSGTAGSRPATEGEKLAARANTERLTGIFPTLTAPSRN